MKNLKKKNLKKSIISEEAKQVSNLTLTPELLEKLRIEAFIESVGASTRMAGSQLSDEEVKELLFKEDR